MAGHLYNNLFRILMTKKRTYILHPKLSVNVGLLHIDQLLKMRQNIVVPIHLVD